MTKSYLLLYSDHFGTREEVRDWVDSIDLITDWRFELPNCFYLISDSSPDELYERLAEISKKKAKSLIVEYSTNSQGWLPSETWHLLENKKRKPKEDA